jgi:hypothetical protein
MIDTRGAGVIAVALALLRWRDTTPRWFGGQTVRQPRRRQVAALASRLGGAWRAGHADPEPIRAPLDPEIERRLRALDARMEHLEALLEGLQDALYRQAVREDEHRADMRERTEPARVARELSADARRRGL